MAGNRPARPRLDPDTVAYARSLVLAQDRALIAFNKPAGLAAQGGSGVRVSLDDLLAAFAKSDGRTPRLIHRLDRDTSGVILAARTKAATAALSKAFAERQMHKTYLAIVCGGAPEPKAGVVALALRKAARRGLDIMETCDTGAPGAQSAETAYETLAEAPGCALVAFWPATGRMHQIRAHAAALGRPIAGDGKYGGLFSLAGVAVPRLMLHAARLAGPHPDGGALSLAAPVPPDMVQVAEALGLRLLEEWRVPPASG